MCLCVREHNIFKHVVQLFEGYENSHNHIVELFEGFTDPIEPRRG